MPIIDVTLFGEETVSASACDALARAIGQRFGAAAGSVWVTLTRRPAADYAENGPPPEPPPVFVRVLAAEGGASKRAARARAVAEAVAATLARPIGRVHVIFEPDAVGRVFFGGQGGSD